MTRTPQVRILKANPLGAELEADGETVDLTFVLEDGDHLHLVLSRAGLGNLSRHIEHVSSKMRPQIDRR